jgi:DNA-binding NarL/FixJ family response regulator
LLTIAKSVSLNSVAKTTKSRSLAVCLLSPHPLVLGEFERILARPGFKVITRQMDVSLATDLTNMSLPQADIFVVDAHAARPNTNSLIAGIIDHHPLARVIVVCEKLTEATSHTLLRLGAKGLLTYTEAIEQLPNALPLVSGGGFWVPRSVLSNFVDSILTDQQKRRLKPDSQAQLSRREREVLDSLLENVSNKEIASKLNISERTVKFHVSKLLNKFGVRRRADLILLCYQQKQVLV